MTSFLKNEFPDLMGWQLIERKKSVMTYVYKGAKRRQLVVCTYGFDVKFAQRNNQSPHFAATVAVMASNNRNNMVGGGADHDLIARLWKNSLSPYLKWHLVSWPGETLHYHANACFWLEKAFGFSKWDRRYSEPDPLSAFKKTVVFGTVEDDDETFSSIWEEFCPNPSLKWSSDLTESDLHSIATIEWESDFTKQLLRDKLKGAMYDWCANRLIRLAEAFIVDMIKLGVAIPPDRQLEGEVVPLLEAENASIDSE